MGRHEHLNFLTPNLTRNTHVNAFDFSEVTFSSEDEWLYFLRQCFAYSLPLRRQDIRSELPVVSMQYAEAWSFCWMYLGKALGHVLYFEALSDCRMCALFHWLLFPVAWLVFGCQFCVFLFKQVWLWFSCSFLQSCFLLQSSHVIVGIASYFTPPPCSFK